MKKVTAIVAIPSPLLRSAVDEALRTDTTMSCVSVVGTASEAVAVAARTSPDVVVLDTHLASRGNAARVVEALTELASAPGVLVLGNSQADAARNALAAGARGYLSIADADASAVCTAVKSVAAGGVVIDPALSAAVMRSFGQQAREQRVRLSYREQQILGLLADGQSTGQIGQRLHLSKATVKTYVQRLYEKLDVHSRAAAIASASRQGLLAAAVEVAAAQGIPDEVMTLVQE